MRKTGKVDVNNVALEIGISPDTLTANINLQEGCMAPDVQHKIVNWLKANTYTGAFHKGLKAKIEPANVSLDGSGASDSSDTSPLSDSGLPNPVAVNVKSVPPRRRTISNIRILKEHTMIESEPEHFLDDLRLNNPWPELKRFAERFDLNVQDPVVHKHIPYVVILVKMADEWAKKPWW